jgi:calcineurin-like phosphoesterase family protein
MADAFDEFFKLREPWKSLKSQASTRRKQKTWLITDTHFNQETLVSRGYRPAGFGERIKQQWKRLVHPDDLVIHLGDVIMGQNGTLGDILYDLPGAKYLVRGNHDHESDGWYMRHGFSFVTQAILYHGVYLTHAPQATLPDGAILNVHGHLHDDEHRGSPNSLPAHCKLLAIEKTDYAPVGFDEFVGFSPLRRLLIAGAE